MSEQDDIAEKSCPWCWGVDSLKPAKLEDTEWWNWKCDCGYECKYPIPKGEKKMDELNRHTLRWVLKRICGYEQNSDDYDYCASLESLKSDVELAIKEGMAWDAK